MFYYPIPTGGVLYADYLSMVNNGPSRDTVNSALAVTGASQAYFAVSDYWWQAKTIIENSKPLADDWWTIDGGKITVFVFRR